MENIRLVEKNSVDFMLKEESEEVLNLFNEIIKISVESGLSYLEINKALYLANKGLYDNTISKRCSLNQK